MPIKHLLWKDAKTIYPLFWITMLGIVAINMIMCLARPGDHQNLTYENFIAIWILLPSLFALGAPAMLVGTEQDSGTFVWLRTLPVRWQSVADSKVLVATIGQAIISGFATVCFFAATSLLDLKSNDSLRDLVAVGSLPFMFFSSLLLLNCGFCAAYWFRTPIVGLLVTIPTMLFLSWILAVERINDGFGAMFAVEICMLLTALICGRLLARYHLRSPQGDHWKIVTQSESISMYRPPVVTLQTRPSPIAALHWQQFRQVGWLCLALTAATVGAHAFIATVRGSSEIMSILFLPSILIIYSGPCWLGGLVFSGDNLKQRRLFFAEHGINERLVWWTRLTIPSLCVVAVVLAFGLVSIWTKMLLHSSTIPYALLWSLFFVASFSLGQFVSQWTQRTVLAFLVAPVLLAIGSVVFTSYYQNFAPVGSQSYMVLVGVATVVLLIGSRWLVGRWMRDELNWNYHLRAAGIYALAIGLPICLLSSWQIFKP